MNKRPLRVWRFSDGKAGHDNQSGGLLEALRRLRPVEHHDLGPSSTTTALAAWLLGRVPSVWRELPAPDLLLGAGHQTHLSLLAARKQRGGKAVVLMRPTLPLALFDLCLIPEHDAPPVRANVLTTRGALNRIQPSTVLESERGLLLIGGPSTHFGWDNTEIYQQITAVLQAHATMQWTLTTSRRTPADFLQGLPVVPDGRLAVVPATATNHHWLPAQLARAHQVWVTADSVSMVYEALTAGAAVGVFAVPLKRSNRISRGLDRLIAQGWLTPFARWRQTAQLTRPTGSFAEADRCAHWIITQWFD